MSFLTNFLLEMGLLTSLGLLYYFFQRRRILRSEDEKGPLIMGFILQSCLSERGDTGTPQMDTLIESLDDYLHNKTPHPPLTLLKIFASSEECSSELRSIIQEGLKEYGSGKE